MVVQLEWPDGKLRKPSVRMWISSWRQIVQLLSLYGSSTRPGGGSHLEMMSGLGRPTVILTVCVTAPVKERPRITE